MNHSLKNQRILIVAPHSDDETFGCAGTIAKAKALGSKVFVLTMSIGDLDHYDKKHPKVKGSKRYQELEKAMKYLKVDGFEVVYFDTQKHLRLDAIPKRDLIAKIERESKLSIDKIKPSIIILPQPSYNQDHEAVFKAGFAACRPHLNKLKPFINTVLSCDAPQLSWTTKPFHPNFYVDISKYLKAKLTAYKFHKSQLRDFPAAASLKTMEYLAHLRGSEIAVEAAEAFYCHRFTA